MKKFIKSSSVKTVKEKSDKSKVNDFVDKFNKYIKKGKVETELFILMMPWM